MARSSCSASRARGRPSKELAAQAGLTDELATELSARTDGLTLTNVLASGTPLHTELEDDAEPGFGPVIGVPLRSGGHNVGAIVVLRHTGRDRFRSEDLPPLASLAVEQRDQTVREIRTSIFDLHTPLTTAPTSLRRRLLDVIADLSDGTGPVPSVRISGPADTVVSPQVGEHATAVVMEGVSNAIRHAEAATLVITIEAGDLLVIDVEDDGRGIPDGARRSGLLNLEKRATECRGSFEVLPRTGGGTHLRWTAQLVDQA